MTTSTPLQRRRRWWRGIISAGLFLSLLLLNPVFPVTGAPPAQVTPTNIHAQAIGQANVRSGPGIEYDIVGTISNGTRYAVYGQHELFPWVLIAYSEAPGGRAWVFADLVTLDVPLAQLPVLTGIILVDTPTPSPTVTFGDPSTGAPTGTPHTPQPGPTTITGSVFVQADEAINVRFGPGIEYPRIERLVPGQSYRVISRHSLYPWLLIELPSAPDGFGWVYQEVVTVSGAINTLPVITVEQVGWPTLTPTPPYVVTSAPPWQNTVTPSPPAAITPVADMASLGANINNFLVNLGFAPEEDRIASVFALNLATGDNFSLGRDIAYSGMSLIKIPILVTFYRRHDQPPDAREAELIGNTMICSGNFTANEMLTIIGDGDPFAGTQIVTETMQALGLNNTFITAPFKIGDAAIEGPSYTLAIEADQTRTQPDFSNQSTPEDLGWLLHAVYQCGMNERGPLMDIFPGAFTGTECRQMILAMSANQINVLSEAGVPIGTRVAHKHGWIDDTHGDAAIIFTPGGDFVLTMAFYQPEWLTYELSWPTMAEVTRTIYNALNPGQPLNAIHPSTVDETCNLAGNPLLGLLTAPIVPPLE